MTDVIRLSPAFDRTDLTPDQAILSARPFPWERVIIAGYSEDTKGLVVRTSSMTREQALWIIEHLKRHVLDYD